MEILDIDKKIALDIFAGLIMHASRKEIEQKIKTPSFFIYYGENYRYVKSQFEKIIKYTDYFEIKSGTIFKSKLFWNCEIYFCDKESFDKNIIIGRTGDIYSYILEDDTEQYREFINILKPILPRRIYLFEYAKFGFRQMIALNKEN